MANPYFNNLPDFLYVNRTKDGRSEGDYSIVKNLFKRAKLRTDIFQARSFFKKYILNENEQNALLLQIKALSEFGKSRLANNIPCSLGLDYEFQYQSE